MSPLTPLLFLAILILTFLYYNKCVENNLLRQKKKGNCDERVFEVRTNLKETRNIILRLDDKLTLASDSIRKFKIVLSLGSGQTGQDISSLLGPGDLSSGKSVRSILNEKGINISSQDVVISILYT